MEEREKKKVERHQLRRGDDTTSTRSSASTKKTKNEKQVSVLSFGAWVTFGDQVDVLAATKLMQRARDAGVNFFDNAEVS